LKKILVLIFAGVILISGCVEEEKEDGGGIDDVNETKIVERGDLVGISYTGKLTNGTIFDKGTDEFITGSGEVVKGLDNAVIGMGIGKTKNASLNPEDAYPVNESLIKNVSMIAVEIPLIDNVSLKEFERVVGVTIHINDPGVINKTFEVTPYHNVTILNIIWEYGVNGTSMTLLKDETTVTMRNKYLLNTPVGSKDNMFKYIMNDSAIIKKHVYKAGETVSMSGTQYGYAMVLNVSEDENTATLDFNHELAGKTLIYEITVNDIRKLPRIIPMCVKETGLDKELFQACYESGRKNSIIEENMKLARSYNVSFLPAFVVGCAYTVNVPSAEFVDRLVDETIEEDRILTKSEAESICVNTVPEESRPYCGIIIHSNQSCREDNKIVIYGFSDLKCDHCADIALAGGDKKLRETPNIAFETRLLHIPYAEYEGSDKLASAAECARDQGVFDEFKNCVFKKYSLEEVTLIE